MRTPTDVLRDEHAIILRGLDVLEAAARQAEDGRDAGAPAEGGPVDVMLEEHVRGRALLQAMAEHTSIERARVARHYAQFLRDHIDKEHEVVFPLAEAVLDEQALEWLAHEFSTVEAEQGPGASLDAAHAAVGALAMGLARTARP